MLGLTGAAVLSAGCPSHLSLVVFFLGLEPSHFSCMSAHFESRSHVCVGRIFKSNALLPPPLCHFCPYSFISCLSFFFMELQFTFFFYFSPFLLCFPSQLLFLFLHCILLIRLFSLFPNPPPIPAHRTSWGVPLFLLPSSPCFRMHASSSFGHRLCTLLRGSRSLIHAG